MGRSRRNKPLRLARKLQTIRLKLLGLSQTEMARALELRVHYAAVSQFELGTREPDLMVLLKYARLAGVAIEVLIDDNLDLPRNLE
jgi:transcriptional regulator with XRE-family HTH domain